MEDMISLHTEMMQHLIIVSRLPPPGRCNYISLNYIIQEEKGIFSRWQQKEKKKRERKGERTKGETVIIQPKTREVNV